EEVRTDTIDGSDTAEDVAVEDDEGARCSSWAVCTSTGETRAGSGCAVGVVVAAKYLDGEPGMYASGDKAPGEAGTWRDGTRDIPARFGAGRGLPRKEDRGRQRVVYYLANMGARGEDFDMKAHPRNTPQKTTSLPNDVGFLNLCGLRQSPNARPASQV
ncbi:hypothetical protein FRC09_005411, partial [Ceratobasidium sp. 395]